LNFLAALTHLALNGVDFQKVEKVTRAVHSVGTKAQNTIKVKNEAWLGVTREIFWSFE
jgi:hypothetical protein